ncbi:MAG: GDP-mannose 4,6-dehydratase [Bacteroidetes bacterium]|nr:GDP-mannose 4,6-dehydratase [Bacteroidota bacterium]
MKKALITGVTGQDGAYLSEFLLNKGYEVHGIKRRTSLFNTDRIDHLYQDPHEKNKTFFLYHGDLTDSSSLIHIIQKVQPDEIYNLAAQSHVAVSFEEPEYTANSDALGALRILEAIRTIGLVTRKITRAISRIVLGLEKCVFLGNLDAKRDWGHAKDFVEVQWLRLQQEKPEDFVVATGKQHSVRDFVTIAAKELGITLKWQGSGIDEIGIVDSVIFSKDYGVKASLNPGDIIVRIDSRYFRPTEVQTLLGDPKKAKNELGWTPKITFDEMVKEMVAYDLEEAKRDKMCVQEGFRISSYFE